METTRAEGSVKRMAAALLISWALFACESGSKDRRDAEAVEPTRQPSAIVSGTLHFEFVPARERCAGLNYNATELRPIRGAVVELIEQGSDRVLDSSVAGEDGSYRLTTAPGREVFVRVRAALKSNNSAIPAVEVRDNTAATHRPLGERALYVLDGHTFSAVEGESIRELIARSGWDGNAYSQPRASAPFAILDTVYRAMAMVRDADPQAEFPPLDIFWSSNNGSAVGHGGFDERIRSGQIGTSFYSPAHNSIFLLGRANDDTEEFDSHVIVHEWAHYFEHAFSRSDSPGGSHSLGEALDKRLAFSEGFATALAGMVLDSSLYCDTSGHGQSGSFHIDMNNSPSGRSGWFSEWSMLSLIYAMWSPEPSAQHFDFAELYQVFTQDQPDSAAFVSIFSFASALKQRFPERGLLLDQLLATYGVSGTDAYGSNEANSGDSHQPDVLPIYTDLPDDGSAVEVCVNDEFDLGRSGNKLAQYRYLHLNIARPGLYEISMATRNPPTVGGSGCPQPGQHRFHSDPDFRLLKNGQTITEGLSCEANSQWVEAILETGSYAMVVSEKRFADPGTGSDFPRRVCFAVKATPLY